MELIELFVGEIDFVRADEERGFRIISCGFYLNKSLPTISIKRKYVETKAIACSGRYMFDAVDILPGAFLM